MRTQCFPALGLSHRFSSHPLSASLRVYNTSQLLHDTVPFACLCSRVFLTPFGHLCEARHEQASASSCVCTSHHSSFDKSKKNIISPFAIFKNKTNNIDLLSLGVIIICPGTPSFDLPTLNFAGSLNLKSHHSSFLVFTILSIEILERFSNGLQ